MHKLEWACKINIDNVGNVLHLGRNLVSPHNPFDAPWGAIRELCRSHWAMHSIWREMCILEPCELTENFIVIWSSVFVKSSTPRLCPEWNYIAAYYVINVKMVTRVLCTTNLRGAFQSWDHQIANFRDWKWRWHGRMRPGFIYCQYQ